MKKKKIMLVMVITLISIVLGVFVVGFSTQHFLKSISGTDKETLNVPHADSTWANSFALWRINGDSMLEYYPDINSEDSIRILSGIKRTCVDNSKLHLYGTNGYAVIDKDKNCRIFIVVPKSTFSEKNLFDEDYNNDYPGFVSEPFITYLESFEQFSGREKFVLTLLEKNQAEYASVIKEEQK